MTSEGCPTEVVQVRPSTEIPRGNASFGARCLNLYGFAQRAKEVVRLLKLKNRKQFPGRLFFMVFGALLLGGVAGCLGNQATEVTETSFSVKESSRLVIRNQNGNITINSEPDRTEVQGHTPIQGLQYGRQTHCVTDGKNGDTVTAGPIAYRRI